MAKKPLLIWWNSGISAIKNSWSHYGTLLNNLTYRWLRSSDALLECQHYWNVSVHRFSTSMQVTGSKESSRYAKKVASDQKDSLTRIVLIINLIRTMIMLVMFCPFFLIWRRMWMFSNKSPQWFRNTLLLVQNGYVSMSQFKSSIGISL